ncbi:MAG: OmpA family protein [Pseudomonadota bacterium]|nr:OmpA family protein [Pseudomonadota bacterium]MDE3037337.1 OmpA family protein [Pseudomonadota bacterium]
MISIKKTSLLAAAFAMLAPFAVFADDNSPHDVVKDTGGSIVLSTNGNCVITMWPSSFDECNGHARHTFSKLTQEQRTVYFDFNRSTLNAHEKKKLDEVSNILLSSKEVASVDIVGYADVIGKSSYNKLLSLRRAETVRAYLARKGLRTRHVRVEGLGETAAFTHCDPKLPRKELVACLAPDRRAEIEVNVKY